MSSINQFKIIFLGDAGVGKSSLIHRYNTNSFLDTPEATLGTAFFCKIMMRNGSVVKLNIWDTSGEEKYRAMTPMYYKDADAVILAYDLTDLRSLDGVDYYKKELKDNGPENISN
jgi:small GTP-binding protein